MAKDGMPLSRDRLLEVLGLDPDASHAQIHGAAARLRERLEARRGSLEGERLAALDLELEDLERSLSRWLAAEGVPADQGAGDGDGEAASAWSLPARLRVALPLLGIAIALIGFGLGRASSRSDAPQLDSTGSGVAETAMLQIESRPTDAWLRVRKPETEELVLKVPAEGVGVELAAGRYELEVSREDCPDSWLREIELEAGETRRFEPTLCQGAGELVVRSNVAGDRLKIDAFDVGATRVEPHVLGVGDHVIRVEKPGYAPFEARVRIRPGERQELRAELVKADGAAAPAVAAPKAPPLPFDVVPPTAPPVAQARRIDAGAAPQPVGGFPAESLTPPAVVREPVALPDEFYDLAQSGRGRARGGSTTWHDATASTLVARFDSDGSGRIDTPAETRSIPCSTWVEIERSFDEGRLGISMTRLYGFDGSEWHPNALGFSKSQRAAAFEQMKACGLAL